MPSKVHADLDRNVHTQLKHLREKLGENATLSDAIAQALASSKDTVAVKIDPTAPGKAFFRSKDARALPQEIKASVLNLAGLVELATTLTGKPSQSLLEEGLIASCTQAIVDHFRAQAGESNAKGASDHKIALAFNQLIAEGLVPTPSKIRQRTGCYLNTIKRWLSDHQNTPPSPPNPL